jgi:hypothetical protein
MEDERMVKTVFLGNSGRRRKHIRPRLGWLDCVEDDLKTMGVRRWRKSVEDCEEWAIILKEAMVKLQKLYAKEEVAKQNLSSSSGFIFYNFVGEDNLMRSFL